jgi:hypothetical protein
MQYIIALILLGDQNFGSKVSLLLSWKINTWGKGEAIPVTGHEGP